MSRKCERLSIAFASHWQTFVFEPNARSCSQAFTSPRSFSESDQTGVPTGLQIRTNHIDTLYHFTISNDRNRISHHFVFGYRWMPKFHSKMLKEPVFIGMSRTHSCSHQDPQTFQRSNWLKDIHQLTVPLGRLRSWCVDLLRLQVLAEVKPFCLNHDNWTHVNKCSQTWYDIPAIPYNYPILQGFIGISPRRFWESKKWWRVFIWCLLLSSISFPSDMDLELRCSQLWAAWTLEPQSCLQCFWNTKKTRPHSFSNYVKNYILCVIIYYIYILCFIIFPCFILVKSAICIFHQSKPNQVPLSTVRSSLEKAWYLVALMCLRRLWRRCLNAKASDADTRKRKKRFSRISWYFDISHV